MQLPVDGSWQTRLRGRAKAPRKSRPPTTHVATAPRQLWCWDMTFLPTEVAGRWYFLYLILDVYSRKIVGFEVHEDDDSDHAARLVQRTALAEGIHAVPREERPVLHGDNGATLKATTVLAMLWWLGVKHSYSRPRVSDDNAFVESLFRTAKYRPEFPASGFEDLGAAREWARQFAHWYNHDHRHSGICYVSPTQRLGLGPGHARDGCQSTAKQRQLTRAPACHMSAHRPKAAARCRRRKGSRRCIPDSDAASGVGR